MKKIVSLILVIALMTSLLSTVASAKIGDVIGYAKYTDIGAYINHFPITSYNINDYTAIVVEDLRNYGFDVVWNGDNRTLSVERSTDKNITGSSNVYKYSYKAGQDSFAYVETDIVTYVKGEKVQSFNINGQTCIYIDALAACGEVAWLPDIRAIKLWIDGLKVAEYKEIEEVPRTTLYAPDGRTIVVENSEVEAHKKVGWYTSKAEIDKANRLSDPKYAEVIEILKKCERYVDLANAVGPVIQSEAELYRMNKKTYVLANLVSHVDQLEGYLKKIIEICGSNRYVYTLKSMADAKRPIVTSSSTHSASTYGEYGERVKFVYDLLCEDYGLK